MSISWRNLVRVLVGIVFLTGSGIAVQVRAGSIPETMAYTGFLRDDQGDPVSGAVDISFELFDAVSGGSARWSENHSGVAVAGGVFSVQLGSVAPFADAGLAFDRPLFLAITVNGEPMDARLPLGSAPYALRAGEGVSNVSVSCTAADPAEHDSIQAAIDGAPAAGSLVVTIAGICRENVNLERDRVTFVSASNPEPDVKGGTVPTDGIQGSLDNRGALQLDGASDVVVRGLVLESDAPGDHRYGLWVFDNGSVALLNVLLRNSWAGSLANNGGFVQLFDSVAEGNGNYGLLFSDNGHGRLRDTHVTQHVSVRPAGDEGAIGAFRSGNVRLQGVNRIINGGDDGLFDAVNPDAAVNSDNGRSIYAYHGVQVRQDGGNSFIVGNVAAGQHVQVALRDIELAGDIDLANNSQMELRTNSTGGQELLARRIDVSNSSYLTFGRNDMELNVTGPVNVSNHSRLGIFRDSITARFGAVNVNNYSEVHVRGTTTIAGDVMVNHASDFNSWQQANTVSLANLNVYQGSRANLRGTVAIAGNINSHRNAVVDLNDANSSSTSNKTVVDVAGRVEVGSGSLLAIHNTAVMNVAGEVSFHKRGDLEVGGSFADPPGCDVCTVDNASALNVQGAGGLNLNQHSTMAVHDGGVVAAKSLNIGPLVTVNLGSGAQLEIQDSGAPGPIDMFSFNQMFWNDGSSVIGNVNLGTLSIINVDGPGNSIDGGFNVNAGVTPGVLNVFGALDLAGGGIDCNGQALNSGTVNVADGSVTFSGGGGFANCPP